MVAEVTETSTKMSFTSITLTSVLKRIFVYFSAILKTCSIPTSTIMSWYTATQYLHNTKWGPAKVYLIGPALASTGPDGDLWLLGENFSICPRFYATNTQSSIGKFCRPWFCSFAWTFFNLSRIWGTISSPTRTSMLPKYLFVLKTFWKVYSCWKICNYFAHFFHVRRERFFNFSGTLKTCSYQQFVFFTGALL